MRAETFDMDWSCRFGYEEHDGSRYCFAHGGFREAGVRSSRCDRAPDLLPGMWCSSDFEHGDPDTRSHAQRERDAANAVRKIAEAEGPA